MSKYIIRAGERARTTTEWLDSAHSFSFGDHYDPANTHHGVLLVQNEDVVAPGQGFDTHPHAETEIVTWVLSGSLVHQDSEGHSGIVYPGLAQRMSAGRGISHSERNDDAESPAQPVHFVQMWVMPDEHGIDPGYEQLDIAAELQPGRLVTVASGSPDHDSAIRIANRAATLSAARLNAGQHVTVPGGRFTHLFVTHGDVEVDGDRLSTSDAVRADDFGGTTVRAVTDAEVLIWSMDSRLGE
ncbi:pirin family protein [Gordonia hydrophobica]|uniref:Pirin family protein n=1 Tax=Gordonia hydrophobica TaxID=40516 RepID=A0ABZ2UA18_9ACTN|nr:pirin-like bicupin family protein [Gordonia hydrophobica]MBM7365616.1 redox-sensitive bicupin YhaK (pirin superfamily) [Gordonia hydrophobica]